MNTTELNTSFMFVDGLESSAFVLDSQGHVVRQNNKSQDSEKDFITSADGQVGVKNCLLQSGIRLLSKSVQKEFIMTRMSLDQNMFVFVQVIELSSTQEDIKNLVEMVSSSVHEINNPLTVISVRTQMLSQVLSEGGSSVGDEKLGQYFEKMSVQADRIKTIVDHMRTYAKKMLSSDKPNQTADVTLKQVS